MQFYHWILIAVVAIGFILVPALLAIRSSKKKSSSSGKKPAETLTTKPFPEPVKKEDRPKPAPAGATAVKTEKKPARQQKLMNPDQVLQSLTYNNISPQGKSRIYFCCHKDDFDSFFDEITDDLLELNKNIAIWYRDPLKPFPDDPQFLDDLNLMQMFVVPVTTRFLKEDDPARTIELKLADEKHIPVLFLMQEENLMNDFNEICGTRQFLDKAASEKDPTSIPYMEKVRKFLGSVLVGDELAARIKKAFAAYIFLSYRKKDRSEAQRIMRMIHENDFCRDIAIWYDEFLTPGEDFTDEIKEAMGKSSLIALVVTPNLLQNPNYVKDKEYPDAVKMGKDILPVEAVRTNMKELESLYKNIAAYKPSGNPEKVAQRLHEILVNIALETGRDDPAHNYLIGLAYLSGIDVEKNTERALEMIKGAAEDGLPEAYEKLVRMYYYGDGVKEDESEAYRWQKAYVEALTKNKDTYSEELYAKICEEYTRMGNLLEEDKDYMHAEQCYDRVYDYANILEKNKAESADFWMMMAYDKIAEAKLDGAVWNRRVNAGVLEQVRVLREEVLKKREEFAEKDPSPEKRRELAIACRDFGDLCVKEVKLKPDDADWKEKKMTEAMDCFRKALKIDEQLVKEEGTVQVRRSLMLDHERVAGAAFSLGNKDNAKRAQEKYLEIAEELCNETGSIQSYDDYAYGCRSMIAYTDRGEAIQYLKKFKEINQQLEERTKGKNTRFGINVIWANMALRNMGE